MIVEAKAETGNAIWIISPDFSMLKSCAFKAVTISTQRIIDKYLTHISS
jgi:hypothetical protein